MSNKGDGITFCFAENDSGWFVDVRRLALPLRLEHHIAPRRCERNQFKLVTAKLHQPARGGAASARIGNREAKQHTLDFNYSTTELSEPSAATRSLMPIFFQKSGSSSFTVSAQSKTAG